MTRLILCILFTLAPMSIGAGFIGIISPAPLLTPLSYSSHPSLSSLTPLSARPESVRDGGEDEEKEQDEDLIYEEEIPSDLARLLEVVYNWKEPENSVDEIVYKRLIKVLGERLGCYYYSMYARSKEDILIPRDIAPSSHRQDGWKAERVLCGGKVISLSLYKRIIESPEILRDKKYRLLYYQQTPFGLLKLGEIRKGSDEFFPDIKFVRCIASEVGKKTPPTLWHLGALFSGSLALYDFFNPPKERKNHPPVADFRTIPTTGTVNTIFYLDAGVSTDPDEPTGTLLVRWDLNNDGIWSLFSFDKITTTVFALPGSYTIRLQVRDRWGLADVITKTITAIAVGPGLASTAHPLFRNTTSRLGVSTFSGPISSTIKWSRLTGGVIEASPSIGSDGTIYIGSYDGNLYGINPANGNVLWTSPLGSPVLSSVAIADDGTLYVGAGSALYAINPLDG
ncbi:MAG: PQQ-binding-like beta-propeller repeat protein, partial [Planctomycetota bacterium]|nr:PQQ-binding-like beta-propeller repeat protein [Planctomycetota bacterium]